MGPFFVNYLISYRLMGTKVCGVCYYLSKFLLDLITWIGYLQKFQWFHSMYHGSLLARARFRERWRLSSRARKVNLTTTFPQNISKKENIFMSIKLLCIFFLLYVIISFAFSKCNTIQNILYEWKDIQCLMY